MTLRRTLCCAALIPVLTACGGPGGDQSGGGSTCTITLATLEQVKTGMDLTEVEAILGKGTKDSSYTAAGEVSDGYTWCGDVARDYLNDPVVEVTFLNGKVDIVQPYNIPAN
jgi:hypothetical protein|tara:strand:- start:1338 stop:1673 length:336 start_codon:yes stop_codon:yes gene_type:complete